MGADTPEGGFSGNGGPETPFDLGDGFRRFADHVPLMMWRTDESGHSTYHNECWLQFTGRPLSEEIGDGWRKGLHPDDFKRHAEIVEKAFESRLPFTIEFRLRRHDGAYRWLLDTGRPLEENGIFYGYLGSCFDITDRKNAEEHAEHALLEKETLLAEIYHRVRNNLQVMVSLIGLYGRAAPESCRGSFDALGQRVRAIALVQQHLHEAPQIASVDLAEYLTRLAEGLVQLRRAGRIAVTVEAGRTALLEPRRVNALGMILAEIVAECLDGTDEGAGCIIRVEVPAGGPAEPLRVRITSGGIAGTPPVGVPRIGPRLIAAYAGQAEIAVSGTGTLEAPLELTLPG